MTGLAVTFAVLCIMNTLDIFQICIDRSMTVASPVTEWGEAMAKPVPFFFCRYQMLKNEEKLDFSGQLQALTEIQGEYYGIGADAVVLGRKDTALIRPRSMRVGTTNALLWSVVRRIGKRETVDCDLTHDRLIRQTIDDPHVHYTDFVAIPKLGVMAVDDRTGLPHLGGKAAVNRFRHLFGYVEGGAVNVVLTIGKTEVQRALDTWQLAEFSFVVRPYNPHPTGDLGRRLSAIMSSDGIGKLKAKATPAKSVRMRATANGLIGPAVELADDGYGQYSMRGKTPTGHEAVIKPPEFKDDKEKNLKQTAKLRELRVLIDSGEGEQIDDEVAWKNVVKALVEFYGSE